MSKKAFLPKGVSVVGPYSPAVEAGGFVYCSGQIPMDYSTGKIVEGDIKIQTQQCLDNLTCVLNCAEISANDIVKATVYLTDINDFSAVNEIYGNYFKPPYPARTAIAVSALPLGSKIEIEVVAKK